MTEPAARFPESPNPVILVPGYWEPMLLFSRVGRELVEEGRQVFGMDEHWPALRDIRTSAELLAEKVRHIQRVTGCDKVDIVAHSLGGLMGRYFIRFLNGETQIDHLVSLATPHHGTYLAYLMPDMAAKQMRPGSEFLEDLNAETETFGNVHYTSIWTEMDQIIVPAASARQEGAENHALRLGFHNQMMFTTACSDRVRSALLPEGQHELPVLRSRTYRRYAIPRMIRP